MIDKNFRFSHIMSGRMSSKNLCTKTFVGIASSCAQGFLACSIADTLILLSSAFKCSEFLLFY
jgi:hypothetical protein